MTLCVLGRESLDELQSMVTELFSGVKTDGQPRRTVAHLPKPWAPEVFHQMVYIEPVKDMHRLELTWMLPSM